MRAFLSLLLVATASTALALPAVAQVTVIQADRVLAEPGKAPLGPTSIVVEKGRITALLPGRQVPAGAKVIDLGNLGQFTLPLANSTVIEDGTLDATRARGAEVQAWSPLGGGGLLQSSGPLHEALQSLGNEFGLDAASLLLRWVASVPDTRVVIGSTDPARIRAAADACATPLPKDAWYALWEAARGYPVP